MRAARLPPTSAPAYAAVPMTTDAGPALRLGLCRTSAPLRGSAPPSAPPSPGSGGAAVWRRWRWRARPQTAVGRALGVRALDSSGPRGPRKGIRSPWSGKEHWEYAGASRSLLPSRLSPGRSSLIFKTVARRRLSWNPPRQRNMNDAKKYTCQATTTTTTTLLYAIVPTK